MHAKRRKAEKGAGSALECKSHVGALRLVSSIHGVLLMAPATQRLGKLAVIT